MSKINVVATDKAPGAVGAYSQALCTESLVFTSGQLPLNPETKKMPDDIREQAKQSLENAKAILEAAGSGMDKVLKTTVYLVDINDFGAVNEVYSGFFAQPYPARSCFAVRELPFGAKVEIEMIGVKG